MRTSHVEWASPLNYSDDDAKNLSAAGINLVIDKDGNSTAADIVNLAVIKELEAALDKYQVSIDTLKQIFDTQLEGIRSKKAAFVAACTNRKEEKIEL